MTQRYFASALLSAFLMLLLADISAAQGIRPEKTGYLKPRVGFAWHLGDTEQSPTNLNLDNWKVDGKFPYAAGLELGYQFNQSSSLSLGWQLTNHPLIFTYGDNIPAGVENDGTVFNAAQLLYRIGGTGRVAPFLAIGGHAIFGQDGRINDPGFGPSAGLGLDIVLNDRTSLVFEWLANLTFPDDALDGVDAPLVGGVQDADKDFAPFDVSNAVTLGLKFNFKSAFTPVDLSGISCPATLETGQTGTFSVGYNQNATQPVTITWNFADGGTGTGTSTSHTFNTAGTYTVTATGQNGRASDVESCTVTVTAPVPAEIVTLTANPMTFDVCEDRTVQFSANVRGDQPITYSWDFGDGTTGTGANVSHVYTEEGTYTVTLTASNAAGTTTRSVTLTAEPCRVGICFEITEMNSVFFARNASALTAEARAALQENLEILRECPNLCARIEGFAGPGERNAQQLSEDRARAVQQFYTDNGIAASRMTTVGRGVVGETTSKKEDTSSMRRADTIPMQCEDMR